MFYVQTPMIYRCGERNWQRQQRLVSHADASNWTSIFIPLATAKWHMLGSTTFFLFDTYTVQPWQQSKGNIIYLILQLRKNHNTNF